MAIVMYSFAFTHFVCEKPVLLIASYEIVKNVAASEKINYARLSDYDYLFSEFESMIAFMFFGLLQQLFL
jgi:hypothetical protein